MLTRQCHVAPGVASRLNVSASRLLPEPLAPQPLRPQPANTDSNKAPKGTTRKSRPTSEFQAKLERIGRGANVVARWGRSANVMVPVLCCRAAPHIVTTAHLPQAWHASPPQLKQCCSASSLADYGCLLCCVELDSKTGSIQRRPLVLLDPDPRAPRPTQRSAWKAAVRARGAPSRPL